MVSVFTRVLLIIGLTVAFALSAQADETVKPPLVKVYKSPG